MAPSSERSPFSRRSFLARGAATAAGVAAASGGAELLASGVAQAYTNGPGRNGISTAKPKRGGHLTFGTDAEEQGFLPTSARFDEVGVMYARTVFDPLTIVTANGGVAPYLAQSVTPNSQYTSWTITLRPNLKFHDGSPCDGAALLQNFQQHETSLLTSPAIKPILKNFQQTGPLTVVANFLQPWVAFPYFIAGGIGGQIAYPVAPAMFSNPNGTNHPIGTGPFIFQSWQPNDHFTATRNPNYWRSGLPYLDSITFRPLPDANSRAQALQSGSINIMVSNTPQITVQFKGNKQWSYIDDTSLSFGEPDVNCLLVNTAVAPFNNKNARLALAKSIDQSAYSKTIDVGLGGPVNGPFVSGTPYYTNTGWPGQDLSGAKKAVQQYQKETGKQLTFQFNGVPTPFTIREQEYLQQQFKSVGMHVSLATFQQNELINNALLGHFQLQTWRQFGCAEPDANYIFWSTTTLGPVGSLAINFTRNNDSQIQTALNQGRAAVSSTARANAYKTIAKRFTADMPYIWLDRSVWAVIAQPKVQNFNNPTTPTGAKAYGMITGSIFPTQIWLSS